MYETTSNCVSYVQGTGVSLFYTYIEFTRSCCEKKNVSKVKEKKEKKRQIVTYITQKKVDSSGEMQFVQYMSIIEEKNTGGKKKDFTMKKNNDEKKKKKKRPINKKPEEERRIQCRCLE